MRKFLRAGTKESTVEGWLFVPVEVLISKLKTLSFKEFPIGTAASFGEPTGITIHKR